MTIRLQDLLRLRHDRGVRIGLPIAAAVLFELFVLSWGLGAVPSAVSAVLAASFLCWRRPAAGLALGSVALLAIVAVGLRRIDLVWSIGPYFAVLVPITAAALDGRRWVRRWGIGLAVAAAAAATAWGYGWGAMYGGRPGIAVSAAIVFAAPFLATTVLRRQDVRARLGALLRSRMPSVDDNPARLRLHVGAAVLLYLLCVGLDLTTGNVATVLGAAPLCAALVWTRTRPDVALALAAVGLTVIAVIAPLETRFGTGEAIAACAAVLPVLGALLDERARIRQLALGLVGVVAVGGSLVGATLGVGAIALALGGTALLVAWIWRQRSTAGRLRIRLRESERRGRVAERGVQVEQERNRIAREVHDVVAHSLAVVIAQADGARFAAEQRPASVVPALEAIAETARTALGEVRTMLHDLRSVDAEGAVPGPGDIAAVVATIRALGVEIQESRFGDERPLTEEAGLAMFRIAQEALTNALRHGDRSGPMTVEFDWGDQVVVLVVTNGVPDAQVPATERSGHGIAGMRERAALVGGECMAGVGSNGRFRVRATLPLLPAPDLAEEEEVSDALTRILAQARAV